MGLFLCKLCNAHLDMSPHKCDPEAIEAHIFQLENEKWQAQNHLNQVRNTIYNLLKPLETLEGESVIVKGDLLRNLWSAANCEWHNAKTADNFLSHWMALHKILRKAFDLFRSKKKETPLEKLNQLKNSVDTAKEVLGYQDSKLDLTLEDFINEIHSARL